MILKFLDKVLHYFSSSGGFIRKSKKIVEMINEKEDFFSKMSDEEIKNYVPIIKKKFFDSSQNLFDNEIISDSFALTREASKRTLGMRHFDVQLIGGLALHFGMIAEMKTGEGKTLTATLPAVLNAISGNKVHIITVNDYLAKRDQEEMSKIYNFLGLSSDSILGFKNHKERKKAYEASIVYGTNNEFGFDYLRDNMEISLEDIIQSGLHFAIIDEADSVLIDEARTPLIISGPSQDMIENYKIANEVIFSLDKKFLEINEKENNVTILDEGYEEIEKFLHEKNFFSKTDSEKKEESVFENLKDVSENSFVVSGDDESEKVSLFDSKNLSLLHHINASAKAHYLFKKDKDYIVRGGKVMIVDEFTGRVMDGRRFSDGLHQALEAKEGLKIQGENQTIASTTFQNYFRLYKRISGMTGTAYTEKEEFKEIYNLKICCVPTNAPVIRKDLDDEIYAGLDEKNAAIIKEIKDAHSKKQPILVGTVSIEKSEALSEMLKKEGIRHHVLNAKHHEQEAKIISEAGLPGGVTIATNMAGRGTDIKLGGSEEIEKQNNPKLSNEEIKKIVEQRRKEVVDAGGLYVIGTERHESRRIDNQLRGRSGRQGDPGKSKFFLSLDDDLMRIFGTDKAKNLLKTLGLKEGEAIFHPLISRAIARSQKKVEARNADIRKNILQYDNILNVHRTIIFKYRNLILHADSGFKIFDLLRQVYQKANQKILKNHLQKGEDMGAFVDKDIFEFVKKDLFEIYGEFDLHAIDEKLDQETIRASEIAEFVNEKVKEIFSKKLEISFEETETEDSVKTDNLDSEINDYLMEKQIWLKTIDEFWRQHLLSMEYLRQIVVTKSFAQKDPLMEYTNEAYELFQDLMEKIEMNFLKKLINLKNFIKEYKQDQLNEKLKSSQTFDKTNKDFSLNGFF
jgi:preprotein translocase subunit SecA